MEANLCALRHKCNVKWNEDGLESNYAAIPTTKSMFRLQMQNGNNLYWMIMVIAMKTVVFVYCLYNHLISSWIQLVIYLSKFNTFTLYLMDCTFAIIGIIWIYHVFPVKDKKKQAMNKTGISNIYYKDTLYAGL